MRSKKAIYNVITNLLLEVILIIYGFIVPKIIIGYFGSDVNGLISSITQFLGYIVLLESGFGPVVKAALYKPIAKKDNQEIINILNASERFFKRIALIFLVYMMILSFIYPLIINKQFDFVFTFSMIIILSITSFSEYYFGATYRLFLASKQKEYVTSIIQMITYLITIVVIVLLIKIPNISIQIIKLVTGLIFILRPLLQNYYVKKKYNIDLSIADKEYKIKNYLDALAQHIAYVIYQNTDITVLTIFSTLKNVSIYSVYYIVVREIKKLVSSFTGGIDASFGDMIARDEKDNLNKKFSVYESFYFSIATIIFSCTIVLIVPFIKIYTSNLSESLLYINESVFGILLVISEYCFSIRQPYSLLVKAAGHFKETKRGAIMEAILNIVISIILVLKYELVGVVIGTIIVIVVRTIEFIYHTNKYILKRNIFVSIKKIFIIIIETCLIVFVSKYLRIYSYTSYLSWFINGIIIFMVSSIITMSINSLIYRREFKEVFSLLKRIFVKKKVKGE